MRFFSKTLDKLKGALKKTAAVLNTDVRTLFVPGRQIDDAFLAEMEEKFIRADMGVKNVARIVGEVRERWRLLLFLIKGKLEAIREGAAIFEEEMMAYTVMPNGQTVAEWANPQLAQILDRNEMPPLLPG